AIIAIFRNGAFKSGYLSLVSYFESTDINFAIVYVSYRIFIELPRIMVQYQRRRQHAYARRFSALEVDHSIEIQLIACCDVRQLQVEMEAVASHDIRKAYVVDIQAVSGTDAVNGDQ